MAWNVGLGFARPDDAPVPLEPLWVHCSACGHEWAVCAVPNDAGYVARAIKAQGVCGMCERIPGAMAQVFMGRKPRKVADGDVVGWMTYSFDTGISSETIWYAITGNPPARSGWYPGVPGDVSDFGRCYRLMETMKVHNWRALLPRVAERFPMWKPYVAAWDELVALYESEMGQPTMPKTYARLKELAG